MCILSLYLLCESGIYSSHGLLADVSHVRDVLCVRLSRHLYPSNFVHMFFFEIINRVTEQLWLLPRYHACEIPRHTSVHRSRLRHVSLGAVFTFSQRNVKFGFEADFLKIKYASPDRDPKIKKWRSMRPWHYQFSQGDTHSSQKFNVCPR